MASSTNNSHPECPSGTASSSSIKKQPRKSILKNPHEHHDHQKDKGASFDEMNILATYHPAGKDYGHMKIDEPKTPYRSEERDDLDPEDISERLTKVTEHARERSRYDSGSGKSDNDFDDDDEHLSPEEKEKARKFREHRKEHYNMKKQIQLAKELLAKEMAELED